MKRAASAAAASSAASSILDVVVQGVARPETAQNLDGLRDRRFVDRDGLEAALEGRVGLDVLAVLVERRRTDALQFAARELGLDHRGEVERTFGGAGPDQRVEFVDEEDHVARGALEFVEDALDAALELAAVLRAGDQRSEVEREDPLVAQHGGDVPADDPLGESLDDRGLADPGLADENGIVLAAPREDRDDAFDLDVAPDDRVERVGLSQGGQVAGVLRERRRTAAERPPSSPSDVGRPGSVRPPRRISVSIATAAPAARTAAAVAAPTYGSRARRRVCAQSVQMCVSVQRPPRRATSRTLAGRSRQISQVAAISSKLPRRGGSSFDLARLSGYGAIW